jgi:hypothetical protein
MPERIESASSCASQKFKLGNKLKWHLWTPERFASLVDQAGGRISKELGRLMNMAWSTVLGSQRCFILV